MSRFIKLIIYLVITLLFICLLSLVIFFVVKPSIFKDTKDVLTYIFSFFSITSLIAYLLKNIRKERKKQGNYTGALIEFLRKEPLFHILIWIFIFIELILFCYILPIHYVNIEIGPNKKVELIKNGKTYNLFKSTKGKQKYRSPRFLNWNEKAFVLAYFSNNYIDTVHVTWSAFAFIDVFRGVQLSSLPLPVEIKIEEVMPNNARICLKTSKLDSTFEAPISFKVDRNDIIKIIVKADANYKSQEISFISAKDTTLEFALKQLKGRVKIIGLRPSGVEEKKMSIYLNGKKLSECSGEIISLEPGIHNIYMVKLLGSNYWAETDTFKIKVLPNTFNEHVETVKMINRKAN